MRGLAFKQKRLTKRQKKASRKPNAMVRNSLDKGTDIKIGNAVYIGCEAVYTAGAGGIGLVKTIPGLPFIRIQ